MPRPHDCNHAELELDECPYCADAHADLLERLNGRDDTASWMVIAAMAIHGEQKKPGPVWRIG